MEIVQSLFFAQGVCLERVNVLRRRFKRAGGRGALRKSGKTWKQQIELQRVTYFVFAGRTAKQYKRSGWQSGLYSAHLLP